MWRLSTFFFLHVDIGLKNMKAQAVDSLLLFMHYALSSFSAARRLFSWCGVTVDMPK